MKYMGKQEMDKGGEGKTVCKQRYRGRDGDEDLSEDAIIRSERGRSGKMLLGRCQSGEMLQQEED